MRLDFFDTILTLSLSRHSLGYSLHFTERPMKVEIVVDPTRAAQASIPIAQRIAGAPTG